MFSSIFLSLVAVANLVAAVPDPLITPAAQLVPRQDVDPSLVGYVSTSGQSEFSGGPRSCDFPATLSTSGSYAQCCESGSACNFWSTCRDGGVADASASVFCDQGYCNTGVIVPTTGGSGGLSFLQCFPTEYGTAPFSLVQDIGDAPIATETSSGGSSSDRPSSSGGSSRPTSQQSSTSSAEPTTTTQPGTAGQVAADTWLGSFVGLVAMFLL